MGGLSPRAGRISGSSPRHGIVSVLGPPRHKGADKLLAEVKGVLHLDEDLSEFHSLVARDPEVALGNVGAGRMIRSATVFEDVAKTICTTNCSWSATVRMVSSLVEHLGEKAPDAPRRVL